MRMFHALLVVGVALAFLLAGPSTAAAAEKGKGKDKEKHGDEDKGKDKEHGKPADKGNGGDKAKGPKETPAGWDKGQKKGWKDEYPPGWDKRSDTEKEKWHKDLDGAREKVGTACDKKGLKGDEKAQMQEALERVARKGKEIEKATEETIAAVQEAKTATEVLKENGIVLETAP